MTFMSIRELRSSTSKLDEAIAKEGKAIITNNGKPAYIMLGIDEDSLESTLINLRLLEAREATYRIRANAKAAGVDQMSEDEIEAEIVATRIAHQ